VQAKDFIMNEEKQEPMIEMTAGEMLHNARTTGRRKREIATIAKLLCIREDFLMALEEGNYRFIPEDVYILGFARSYAVELGLDPDEVIAKLKRELGLISEEEKEEEKICEPKQSIKIDKALLLKYYKISLDYVKKHWLWFASGAGVLVVLIVLIALLAGGSKPEVQDVAANTETTVVAATVVKEPDFRYPVREKFEAKNRKESRVVLQAEKESWVKIEDARGSSVFSRVLIPGDVYYMPLGDKFKATFGNVGAIDVWVDGQLVKKLGPANTKKSGISMAPDALKAVGFAE
jgi:cytoskeletal protein RodZ